VKTNKNSKTHRFGHFLKNRFNLTVENENPIKPENLPQRIGLFKEKPGFFASLLCVKLFTVFGLSA